MRTVLFETGPNSRRNESPRRRRLSFSTSRLGNGCARKAWAFFTRVGIVSSSRQAGRATDSYDCFRKRGLRRRLRADRSTPLGGGCSSRLVWSVRARRRAAVSFIFVLRQSTHHSSARGCGVGGGCGGGAEREEEKKKKSRQ